MEKVRVSCKEFEGNKFYYLDFGSEAHGRKSFRLWIAGRLIQKEEKEGKVEEFVSFPCPNSKIFITPRGSYVLRPEEGYTTFDLYVECGYRGSSRISVLDPPIEVSIPYYIYRSPRGNLGISEGKLVTVKGEKVKYRWEREGRTYGSPKEGVTVVYADGRSENLEDLPDGLEAIEELKEVLK